MQVVYAKQEPPKSWTSAIFLAGPSPRPTADGTPNTRSWRIEALECLEAMGYAGVVFVPEPEGFVFTDENHTFEDQIEWEEMCLNFADVILFWVPRSDDLPGFTTNDEWGYWKGRDPAKLVIGAPKAATKIRYLNHYAEKFHLPRLTSLASSCASALAKIDRLGAAQRTGGERCVPLHIWHTVAFQRWYENLLHAGNELINARVEWVWRVGKRKQAVYFWALHVDIYVSAEERHKSIEVVLGRPDISSVLLYEPAEDILDTRIVLVKEFRSPVSNEEGFVYELPGGSSNNPEDSPLEIAKQECFEEVGIVISEDQFIAHEVRQLVPTLLAHKAHLFSVKLDKANMDIIAAEPHIRRGEPDSSEVIYTRVMTYREILADPNVDWSTLGMVTSVLQTS